MTLFKDYKTKKTNKMGRYYSGNIAGKFWFACQSSADAENFGGKSKSFLEYACCQCHVMDDSPYCENCYTNIEDHIEDANSCGGENIIYESQFFDMVFDGDQLKEVQGHIAELDKTALKFIKSFTMNADSNYEYDYEVEDEYVCKSNQFGDFNDKVSNCEKELIARWCLAKQVEQCLIDNGQCIFSCEP